ncbi:DUF1836 domain-containing protein [Streptococcus chenjunshii]|uniref:DUF1836 domain-containing protein n=1 Tax=Streptococcus chenjunshii TaxID=2173853 RepID=A0A372KN11_9STRE|nr:DUF1836 domain-containing protein [Streptococcus chenjunshii]AXQ78809.1 DUF1836 domain-containing protein [Streptococcus chenjunshii]RFU51570.1 DUF1836 domain-containing protein [Streptococcus chenjunshii]RFU53690.1 DUF1836 domain-containing protein [Streptococcus chenjunshii]
MAENYPKWTELPELDLYLDQVLLYVNQISRRTDDIHDRDLTASMINNYVKHGHIDKPVKKKYSRRQLARLIVITSLKNVFSIQEISQTLAILTQNDQSQVMYDYFAACMNNEQLDDIPAVIISACQTLKLYQQTHQLVLELQGELSHES